MGNDVFPIKLMTLSGYVTTDTRGRSLWASCQSIILCSVQHSEDIVQTGLFLHMEEMSISNLFLSWPFVLHYINHISCFCRVVFLR